MGSKKKVWVPKKKELILFFGPNIVPKKVWDPKKSMSSKKKGTYFFPGQIFQKKNGIQKKIWVPFPKSMGSKKKYEFQKERNSYFWGLFCRYFFFCLNWKSVQTKKEVPAKSVFPGTFFFVWTDFQFKQKKSTCKKVPKSMSSFFFGTHTFFWIPYFFWHNVWLEKSMSSCFLELILFFGSHTDFLAQCLARKKYEFLFWNSYIFWIPLFFSTQCLAWKKYEFLFFGNSYFFFNPVLIFWHNVWPKKSMSSFFWNSYFFSWIPYFFRHKVWPEKSMSFFLFGTHTFFWIPYWFFGTMFGPKKVWVPFFWNSYCFLDPILFFARCLARKMYEFLFFLNSFFFGTHSFFGAMLGPENGDFLFVGRFFFGRMFGLNMAWVVVFHVFSFLSCDFLIK